MGEDIARSVRYWGSVLILLGLVGCAPIGRKKPVPTYVTATWIRVLIDETDNGIIKFRGGATITVGGRSIKVGGELQLKDGYIQADGLTLDTRDGVVITPEHGYFIWKGHRYRGKLMLKAGKVINYLPLEEYLYSVVAAEMGYRREFEALKAQAVAARTYAVRKMGERRNRDYDIHAAPEVDQKYVGMDNEYVGACDAVNATRGEILVYGGEPIRALYSACCGGYTNDPPEGWDTPYLVGKPDPYCKGSPYERWRVTLSRGELEAKLGCRVQSIKVVARNRAGRVRFVEINGKRMVGGEFRARLELPSTWFEVKERGDSIIIEGRGYGHGYGMCQWGAIGMAKRGYSYRQILGFYYPGTRVVRYMR